MDILMAVVDFIPVILFLIGAIHYQRDLYNKMSKGAFSLFAAGTIFVFVAGVFKATYKLLYYCNVCDFQALNSAFFPMQTTGFGLAGSGILAMLVHPQGENKIYSFIPLPIIALVAPAVFNGTMIFVTFMVLGVLVMDGCLVYIAIKRKTPLAIVLLVIAFICTLGMGYLSTKAELSDWIKEFVNTIGQACFLASSLVLRKHGLKEANALN